MSTLPIPSTRNALRCGVAALAIAAILNGCAPRLRPLGGDVAPVTLPRGQTPRGHSQITFDWEYADVDLSGKGTGVSRIAGPDSVRLDFFLAGGFGGGAAVLIGDTVQTPGPDFFRRMIPPPVLLWASLGRSTFPAMRDTVIRREGDLLRGDLGRPVEWRVTFRADTLVRLEHVEGGRVSEWVERVAENRLEYRQEAARRSLRIHIIRVENVGEFDASIWHIDR